MVLREFFHHHAIHRCITSMRRQYDMPLNDMIILYLQMVESLHLVRLIDHWFRLDVPLVSAFIEQWWPKMYTFHMSFGECMVMLQDVAYQLDLFFDGQYVSRCLTDFDRPAWDWFQELLSVLPSADCIDKFAVKCTWMQEIFRYLPQDADKEQSGGTRWRTS
ncbi:hypothetical protein Ahy_A06g027515 [Arachis hypogaea]|uniref:Aminotransferase-like plant mobile domain-containing protein n=1 Tax=Arachis hypogaea TaxID=3818 RepID=A0A445CNZ2_ARAHY|nr:hypothetical protein Ahy_A06g027515 [Arachis hypogaea]